MKRKWDSGILDDLGFFSSNVMAYNIIENFIIFSDFFIVLKATQKMAKSQILLKSNGYFSKKMAKIRELSFAVFL